MNFDDYKRAVRNQCTIRTQPGPASDPKDVVLVDWHRYFGLTSDLGQEFLLGWDPTSTATTEEEKWFDRKLQYAPAPFWADKDAYIAHLEELVEKYAPKGER